MHLKGKEDKDDVFGKSGCDVASQWNELMVISLCSQYSFFCGTQREHVNIS